MVSRCSRSISRALRILTKINSFIFVFKHLDKWSVPLTNETVLHYKIRMSLRMRRHTKICLGGEHSDPRAVEKRMF
jgi:hypothetical protein